MMNPRTLLLDEPERGTDPGLAVLSEKLDRIQTAVEALDRRREELEELVTDLLPAVNGTILQVMQRLDVLERNGTLALAREAADALETAATEIDPQDVRALGSGAATGIRALRALTEPEIAVVAERVVGGIRAARVGKPPTLRDLWRRMHAPHVRRGLGAMLDIVRALGEGAPATASRNGGGDRPVRPPRGPAPAAQPAIRPAPRAAAGGSASATHASPNAAAAVVELAGRAILLDGEGFLADREDWSPEVAHALADEVGIGPLTEAHWKVIDFCREDALLSGAAPGLRRITQKTGTQPKELYTLFPKGPGILAARIAGLSKPKSCV